MADITGMLQAAAGVGGAEEADPNFNDTVLLLHGDGTNGAQNNTFLDSSTNNFTITRAGTTTQGTFSPFSRSSGNLVNAPYNPAVHGGSGFFDGTNDTLSVADDVALRPGTSAFTIEAWVYRRVNNVAHTICAKGATTPTGFVFGITSGNVLRFTDTSTNIDSTGTILADSWNHVAVVREGTGSNELKLYINGVQDGQGTSSTDFNQTTNFRIGDNRGGTEDFNGFISDLRFTRSAVYTTGFTPSTTPLTAITDTELLLNFTNAGIIDNVGKHNLVTANQTQIDTGTKKFGTGSIEFDGSDYLASFVAAPSMNFSGDFTIELWVNFTTATTEGGSNRRIFGFNTGAPFEMVINTNGTIFVWNRSTTYITSGSAVNTGNWVHLALTRESNSLKLFVDGTQSGSTATVSTSFTPTAVYFGANPGSLGTGTYLGFMDDIRFTNGVARYLTSFTPPTKAFPDL